MNNTNNLYMPSLKKYSLNELKEKIGVSFTIKEIDKDRYDIKDAFNHQKYIKDVASKIASLDIPLNKEEVRPLKCEIMNKNLFINNKSYIAQEVFANTKEQNEKLPENHDECCKVVFGYGYDRFFDNDLDLKKDFLSLKINDKNISKGIDVFIDEIISCFYGYHHIDLMDYNSKKIKNMIFTSKALKERIIVAKIIISELKDLSNYYLERPIEGKIPEIQTVYLKDISDTFYTYEIPELVDNKIYLVDKSTFSIKEVDVTLHFYSFLFNLNELNKGNFYTNFYFLDKNNERVGYYEINPNENNKLNIYSGKNYIFFNKDDAKTFSNEKLDKLIEYSDKVKNKNNSI